ncbi:MAG TPA: GAF domain-containing SpoIIE family protein phosphatase [Acidimicrobiales bacterium]|nr:GAF domain-containing SpoIIE family protein phosphatase [Acidimicrobiales bacterium]
MALGDPISAAGSARVGPALRQLAAHLAQARSREEMVSVVLGEGLAVLGADTGSLCLLDATGKQLEIVAQAGYSSAVQDAWAVFPLDAPLPASDAVRTRRQVFLTSPDDRDTRYPVFRSTPVVDDEATASVPIAVDDASPVLGALVMGFAKARQFDVEDASALAFISTQCAAALHRADAQEAADRAQERLRFLAEASAALGSSLDWKATLTRVASLAVPRVADWCSVILTDDSGAPTDLVIAHRDPGCVERGQQLYHRYPPSTSDAVGIGAVLRTGEPEIYREIPAEVLAQYARDDEHLELMNQLGFGSGMTLPLQVNERVIGVLSLINAPGRIVDDADVALGTELSRRAAAAIERSRLFAAERRTREQAERAVDRLARLQAIANALALAVTPEDVAEVVLTEAIPELGAGLRAVWLLDDDGTTLRLLRQHTLESALVDQYLTMPLDADLPVPEAVRTHQLVEINSWEDRDARYPAIAGIEADSQAWAAIPLVAEGRALGGIVLGFREAREFTDNERRFFAAVGDQCAQAIRRCQLFVAERDARERLEGVAETLRRGLSPPALPDVAGIELAACYRPAVEDIELGGDFYDVFGLPDGRWAFMVGDVCGRGAAAAATTALVRHTARAEARHLTGPRQVARAINDAMRDTNDTERFCTAIYGELSVADAGVDVTLLSAGHPEPRIVRADGTVEIVPTATGMLGVFPIDDLPVEQVGLGAGDALVMFTDGVLEARGVAGDDGIARGFFEDDGRVEDLLADLAGAEAPAVAKALEAAVTEYAGGRVLDDIAILVVRVPN